MANINVLKIYLETILALRFGEVSRPCCFQGFGVYIENSIRAIQKD